MVACHQKHCKRFVNGEILSFVLSGRVQMGNEAKGIERIKNTGITGQNPQETGSYSEE